MGRANRAEVIDSIRRRTGLPATVVRTVYDAFFDEVVNQVTMGNSVMLTGFGNRLDHRRRHGVRVVDVGLERLVQRFGRRAVH